MNEYMIIIRFITSFNEEFVDLLPNQRVQINRLMEKGIITSYSLSADRGTLWVTLLATSLEAVEKTLRMMPLFKFMRYDIIELMFHNSPVHAQMHFSMN
jgi:muconolactone delta-isomerase